MLGSVCQRKIWESVLSFHHVSPGARTQAVRLGSTNTKLPSSTLCFLLAVLFGEWMRYTLGSLLEI